MPTNERKQWRAVFTDTIMELSAGKANILDVAGWAIQAQYDYGDRDPREVAREKLQNWTQPIPERMATHSIKPMQGSA